MGQYYYAVSSLPHLSFDSETFPSDEQFVALCRENLSKADLRAVLQLDLTDEKLPEAALVKKWFGWNSSLQADLAFLRAQGRGKNADEYQNVDRIAGTEEVAREAFAASSPLAAEQVIERGRWSFLDELEVGHYFDLGKLVVYRLRISILERKATFQTDTGRTNFRRIYDAVTEGQIGIQPEQKI
ncbi:MAG: DUF2764 family protein [Spirochaetales bacterium]|nr:DUF2764 family protein [Spirochaetales bacterium]